MRVANPRDLALLALRDTKMHRRLGSTPPSFLWGHCSLYICLNLWKIKHPHICHCISTADFDFVCINGFLLISLQAVDDMNGKELNGRQVYVGRAQKKGERQNELKRKFEQMKQDRMTRYQVCLLLFQGN